MQLRRKAFAKKGGGTLHSVYDERDDESEKQLERRIEKRRVAAQRAPVEDLGEFVQEETVGRFFLAQQLAQTAAKLLRVPASEAVYEYKQMSDHVSWRCSGHFIRKIEAFYLRKYLLAVEEAPAEVSGVVACWAVPFMYCARGF